MSYRQTFAAAFAGAALTAAALSLSAGADVGTTVVPPFQDVPITHPHAASIDDLRLRGIAIGDSYGNFNPDAPVTRGQMATFLSRTIAGLESGAWSWIDDDGVVHTPFRCEEDMPCWDCSTMGNLICGPLK